MSSSIARRAAAIFCLWTLGCGSGPTVQMEDPAPPGPDRTIATSPTFTPFTVAPALQNLQEVLRALAREYPNVLRDAGIGGTVQVWFFIDEEGRVQETQVDESSGYPLLDQAALKVARVYRFSPAFNGGQRVAVWVLLPITLQVR